MTSAGSARCSALSATSTSRSSSSTPGSTRLEEADREALTMLRSLLLEQRESARAAMLEMLDSRRYEAFVGRFGRTLRARHLARSGPASRPARALAPDLIEGRFRSVRKAGARIGPASPATEYHRLRIRCKRLRYALEFLADLYPGATRAADRTARDGPGRSRSAPGRGRRDRTSPAPRRLVQRRPRPRDDLLDGRGRRALPAVDDRATSTSSRPRTPGSPARSGRRSTNGSNASVQARPCRPATHGWSQIRQSVEPAFHSRPVHRPWLLADELILDDPPRRRRSRCRPLCDWVALRGGQGWSSGDVCRSPPA